VVLVLLDNHNTTSSTSYAAAATVGTLSKETIIADEVQG